MLWEEVDVLFIKAEERGFHVSHLEREKKGNAEGRTNSTETWFYYFHFTYEETEDQRGYASCPGSLSI